MELTTSGGDGETIVATGHAEVTFINRGHTLMESFYSEDLDGHPLASVFFLGFNPTARYVFHDITAGRYAWYAHRSTDRGAT